MASEYRTRRPGMIALNLVVAAFTVLAPAGCRGVGNFTPLPAPSGPTGPAPGLPGVVRPTYAYATTWNAYVRRDGTTSWNASGAGCSAVINTTSGACLHAGEQRKVTLPATYTSCGAMSASDALGAFDWTCDATGGTVTFYSTSLKFGKGLRDLIDGTALAWRPNAVTIAGGGVSLTTASSAWWTNRVLAVPSNAGATDAPMPLDTPGAVYVAATNVATRGYNFAADEISLVTLGSSVITYVGASTNNCSSSTGSTASPDGLMLICGGSGAFTWLEANVQQTVAGNSVVYFVNSKFLRVHNTTILGGSFDLNGGSAPRVTNLRIGFGSIGVASVTGGFFRWLQSTRGSLYLNGGGPHVVSESIFGDGYQGMVVQSVPNLVVSRVSILATQDSGIEISGSSAPNAIFSFITTINNNNFGVANYTGTNAIFHNILNANASTHGWNMDATSSLSHIATFFNRFNGMAVNASNNKFSGVLLAGGNGNADCNIAGGTAPGLSGACVGTDASTGQLTYVGGVNVTSSFKGKVLTYDPANASDVNGGSPSYPAAPLTFDWLNFTNASLAPFDPFKSWGADGGAFPAADHRSSWENLNAAGRIWDLSLASTDTVLRNTTDTGATANAPLVDGAPCPAWVGGSRTLTDVNGTYAYLANAMEVLDDGVGNDNGLCESNEVCIAAPNYGAYQGDGDYTAHACVFPNGTVTGVTMHFYPTNGR